MECYCKSLEARIHALEGKVGTMAAAELVLTDALAARVDAHEKRINRFGRILTAFIKRYNGAHS